MADVLNNLGGWNIVFLILTVLSIILSIYLHQKSQNLSIPIFDSISNILIQNKIKDDDNLKIFYNEQLVDRITETKLAFWNNGAKVINNFDVAPKDPICIELKNSSSILKCDVVYTTSAINNFQVLINSEKCLIEISFDYLGLGEGGIIAFLHTGGEGSLKMKGTIKGVKKIIKYNHRKDVLIDWAFDSFLFWVSPLLDWLPKKLQFIGLFLALAIALPITIIFGVPQVLITFFNKFFRKKSLLEVAYKSQNHRQDVPSQFEKEAENTMK